MVVGGGELQDQFERITKYKVTKKETVDGKETDVVLRYESARYALKMYYAPKLNKRFERHQLRSIKQEEDESFVDFVNRILDQANRCEFTDVIDAVVDQIIEGCKSSELRKQLLSEDKTYEQILHLGKTAENVKAQVRVYENRNVPFETVQRIQNASHEKPANSTKCFNCNRVGHLAREKDKCIAAISKYVAGSGDGTTLQTNRLQSG